MKKHPHFTAKEQLKRGRERRPILLGDYHLLEQLANFDRERIPERVVHARGAGAFGVFKPYQSMASYTRAAFLQEPAVETKVLVRFSTNTHGSSSPETLRDVRGFAVKFYTSEGNYDLVGNNLPVFFIRDASKFPSLVHSIRPSPDTNIQSPNHYWRYMSFTPESTHMLIWLFSDRGIPASYREMDGFGVHAFKWVNEEEQVHYVKYLWKCLQGVRCLTVEEAAETLKRDFNHATRDLQESITSGYYPEWELYVQIMNPSGDALNFDPLDPTQEWPEDQFPLTKVGLMTLDVNPSNYFAEVEQAAFSPGSLVPGIEVSEDNLLQGRLFSYPDTQRYRLGGDYLHIAVNGPIDSTSVHHKVLQATPTPVKGVSTDNEEASDHVENESLLYGTTMKRIIEKTDDFSQAGARYRSLQSDEQDRLVLNIVNDLKQCDTEVQINVIINFFIADESLGARLSEGLGLDLSLYI